MDCFLEWRRARARFVLRRQRWLPCSAVVNSLKFSSRKRTENFLEDGWGGYVFSLLYWLVLFRFENTPLQTRRKITGVKFIPGKWRHRQVYKDNICTWNFAWRLSQRLVCWMKSRHHSWVGTFRHFNYTAETPRERKFDVKEVRRGCIDWESLSWQWISAFT